MHPFIVLSPNEIKKYKDEITKKDGKLFWGVHQIVESKKIPVLNDLKQRSEWWREKYND